VAAFGGDVLDVDSARFRDTQPQEAEETGQGVVGRAAGGTLGDEGAEFHPVEPERGRLGVDPGPANVLGRGVLQDAVDDGEAVEAGQRRQSPPDGRPGQARLFEHAGVELDVRSASLEDREPGPFTPGEEGSKITGITRARGIGVPGQEPGHRQAGLVEKRTSRSHQLGLCHRKPPLGDRASAAGEEVSWCGICDENARPCNRHFRAGHGARMGHDDAMSWDLDEQEARELVQQYLAAKEPPRDDEWVITTVAEFEWGWAISWVNRRHWEGSRSSDDTYAGGGPYLVDRKTARVAMAGSAHPVKHYIRLWRRGELADLPRPT